MKKILIILISILVSACSSSDDYKAEILNYDYSQDEISMIDLVNQYRAGQSFNVVVPVNHIGALCERNNQQMIINGVGHYNFQDAIRNLNSLGYTRVSEIVGYNYISNQGFLSAIQNDTGCLNILRGDYNYIGVSITTGTNGRKYYTLIFAKKNG